MKNVTEFPGGPPEDNRRRVGRGADEVGPEPSASRGRSPPGSRYGHGATQDRSPGKSQLAHCAVMLTQIEAEGGQSASVTQGISTAPRG
jgi:hypothetical protein